ncbi:MAG: polynucleotide adenylyltransferase PcnB [Halothiobacillaceae bacterium]
MLSQQPHPNRIPREAHNVSRRQISQNALNVLYRLQDAGFGACLVGGGVRDLLLGRQPKDFDVVTDARPEQVRRLFRHARIIGRRFKIVHVVFKDEVIEVSTFRGPMDDNTLRGETGMIIRDNEYGTIDDDVWRRDFACNALYYDIADFSIIDYTNGVADVQQGRLRLIGDPETRYREDPVRMLRAARFRAKLGFDLDEMTREPLARLGELLVPISSARLFDESLKLFQSGHGLASFETLRELDLFKWLFPELDAQLDEPSGRVDRLVRGVLASTDHRVAEDLGVNPAFLFAVLLWEGVRQRIERLAHQRVAPGEAMEFAIEETLRAAIERIAIPRRLTDIMREIWMLQPALGVCPDGAERRALLGHGRFRAALDMLCLRAESGEPVGQACKFWRAFEPERAVLEQATGDDKGRKPRRRRRPRKKKPA